MNENEKKIVEILLQIKAIKLDPANPFTWASGWKSPIYCDNRKTLSFPEVRAFLKADFTRVIREKYPDVELIAGVATGAIAIGVLVAEELGLPFVYVRPKVKDHGLGNQIEGVLQVGQKVVVIEDLISTGNSSLNAVAALREAKTRILGMIAIFSYQFQIAEKNFKEAGVELNTLGNYSVLIEQAEKIGFISPEKSETLKKWRKDPGNWIP